MTIHGSKGLEFPVVHLPALATPYMPSNWRGVQLLPPASLTRLAMDRDDHEAEEQCLFFVALSRARDHLSLSRAEKYTTRNAKMSKFLTSIEGAVPCVQYPGSGKSFSNDEPLRPPLARECYPGKELDVYTKCPARYRYEVIEELRGGGNDSAYLGFHRCVYLTIGWLEEERRKGNTVNDRGALAQLAEVWSAEGPVNHAFEGYYRSAAESMVKGMVEAISSESAQYDRQEWVVPVGGRKILITPDRVLIDADGTVRVQRIRTGRRTKSESEHPVYALLRRGAAIKYPRRRVVIETFYLATRERVPVPGDDDEKLLEKYERAIEGIESGDFHAVPDNRRCPNCQCYFMCGG
jgi:ATP-dependent DNA helicase UvrD/PcrA